MAATFDRMSGGRLIVNVVGGGDPVELAGDGIFVDHDARYELMDEFLCIWRQLVGGEEFSFDGKYLKIAKGNVPFPCVQEPHPPLFMGGSSEAAKRIAVEHIDTLLTWAEPLADLAAKLTSVRAAETKGRRIRFGIRLHIIVRETEKDAWAAADDLIRYLDAQTIAGSQAVLGRTQSEGQKRMNALHNGGKAHDLEVSPNLWAGVALVTGGAGTALGRQSESRGRAVTGIRRSWDRDFHSVGLPSSRGGISRRGNAFSPPTNRRGSRAVGTCSPPSSACHSRRMVSARGS
jgi:alkanesulfonate monooxygenase